MPRPAVLPPLAVFLALAVLLALAGGVVAPPPPQNPGMPGSFPTDSPTLVLTAWSAAGPTVGTLPPLPKPVVKATTQSSPPVEWAAVKPADLAEALAILAPVAAPAAAKKGTAGRPSMLRRRLQDATSSPAAARAAAAIAAATTGSDPAAASLLPDARSDRPASNVGGGDGTGGAMEAAAADAAAAATRAAAADPTVPLTSDVPAVATGPIPPALSQAMQPAAHASPAAPLGGVGAADATAAKADADRNSMDTAALPGARTYAATKPLPLLATLAPAGLGPVFAASRAAALPAENAHGSGPATRAAAVGGVEVCAVPGGKLLVLTADAVAVRDAESGALLAGPTPISAFFQDPTGGTFTSPRCVFDGAAPRPGEKRTYLAAIRTPADPDAGARPGAVAPAEPAARLVVAATADGLGGDPTGGWVGPFSVAVDGVDRRGVAVAGGTLLPGTGGCPTLGCAARGLAIGLDAHGLWATTELWTPDRASAAVVKPNATATAILPPGSFVGGLAVGLSKAALRSGAPSRPPALVLTDFPPWAARGLAPGVTEAWAAHDSRAGGTAYIAAVGGSRLGVWAIHHTSALRDGLVGRADGGAGAGGVSSPDEGDASTPPAPTLPFVAASPFMVDHTRAAADLPPSFSAGIQRPSSLGLAASAARPHASPAGVAAASRTAPLDAGGPRRLARAAWDGGRLWLATAAPVFAGGLSPTVGTAFFAVKPDVGSLGLRSGSTVVETTGWVAVDGAATLAPSIAVGKGGVAAIPFVLASPAFEPAFAYATYTPEVAAAKAGGGGGGGVSAVKVVTAGQPSDGSTPAAALARASGRSGDEVGAVQAFSFSGETGAPPAMAGTAHTPSVAAGSGHAGALDSIAAGLFSGATASPDGASFWVGGRRGACVSGSGAATACVPAWAAAVGRVAVAAEVV